MFLMNNIYTYTDNNAKVYSHNQLTVSFDFHYEVDVETAVEEIDELIRLADNQKAFSFLSYAIDMYITSPRPTEES